MAKSFQDTIVLFGDSITQEWAAGSLAHRFTSAYSRRLDVLNRGFGGYTSEWNLPIFEKAFAKKKEQKGCPVVRLVTLWLGANDSTFPQRHQHLPLAKYSENMKYYVRSILSPSSEYYQPHAYVLLLTPPPLVEKMREEAKLQYPPEQRTPADRSLDNTKRYRDEIIKIGAEFKRTNPEFADKLRVIDTWEPLIAAAGGDVRDEEAMRRFFTDGLHMTSEGYEIVYNACLDVIKKDFKGLDPDDQTSLPMTFPHWDSVDPKAVRKTVVQAKPKYVVAQKAETGFQSNVLAKLLLFAFLVAVVPIATYFTTIKHAFDGNSTSAAIAAIASANIVMVAYVVVAFNEDAGPALTKKTQ